MKGPSMNWIYLAIIAFVAVYMLKQLAGSKAISPNDMATLMKQNPTIIDVRSAVEYQSGHLANTINIPVAELGQEIGRHAPDKGQPILLHCASGMRSATGKKALEQLGYTNVHNLGSFSQAQALLQKAQ